MVLSYINHETDLLEAINAFPFLDEVVRSFDVDVSNIQEGESILHYFEQNNFECSEIDLIVRKLNFHVSSHLKSSNQEKKEELKAPIIQDLILEEE